MMQAFIAVAALVAGILLGYIIRGNSAKSEKALLEKQVSGSTEALAAAQRQFAQAQASADARAGFESLAAERAKTIVLVATERDAARAASCRPAPIPPALRSPASASLRPN